MLLNEVVSMTNIRKKVVAVLSSYVETNDNKNLDWAYHQAIKLFPKHKYVGPMYRGLTIPNVEYDWQRNLKMRSREEVEQYTTRQFLRYVRLHPRHIYSFSTDQSFLADIFPIVLYQKGEALDVIGLLEEQWPIYFKTEYYNEFPEQQEVLAPLLPSTRIIKRDNDDK